MSAFFLDIINKNKKCSQIYKIKAYLSCSVVSDTTGYGQDAVGAQTKELTHLSELGESFVEVRFKGWMGVHQAEKGGNESSKQRVTQAKAQKGRVHLGQVRPSQRLALRLSAEEVGL